MPNYAYLKSHTACCGPALPRRLSLAINPEPSELPRNLAYEPGTAPAALRRGAPRADWAAPGLSERHR